PDGPRNRTGLHGSRSSPDRSPGYDRPAPRRDHKVQRSAPEGVHMVDMATAAIPKFDVEASEHGEARLIVVSANGKRRVYELRGNEQPQYADFFRDLARDFGTRPPHLLTAPADPYLIRRRPLLTENVNPRILVGYGDPAVLKTGDGWWLVATSNDAPDAF